HARTTPRRRTSGDARSRERGSTQRPRPTNPQGDHPAVDIIWWEALTPGLASSSYRRGSAPSNVVDLFLCDPGGVLDGLLDVRTFQIRIPFEDLLKRSTVCHLPDDDGDGNPHATDASP